MTAAHVRRHSKPTCGIYVPVARTHGTARIRDYSIFIVR